ncbi:MAG: winged helix-turn-helix domain-containing protein [Planctomycetes bacterium]|nr:winged helix-turn-helix domain-containing protein [Planctomycetota bacterium]
MTSEIGEAAGRVWQCLNEHGEMTPSAVAKKTGLKRDVLFAGIGWLAREDKVNFRPGKRSVYVSLV